VEGAKARAPQQASTTSMHTDESTVRLLELWCRIADCRE
jgi:hypothetical protein